VMGVDGSGRIVPDTTAVERMRHIWGCGDVDGFFKCAQQVVALNTVAVGGAP